MKRRHPYRLLLFPTNAPLNEPDRPQRLAPIIRRAGVVVNADGEVAADLPVVEQWPNSGTLVIPSPPSRQTLWWHLDNYLLTTVAAGSIYLIPRAPRAPLLHKGFRWK